MLKKWLSYGEKRLLGRDLRPDEAREFSATVKNRGAPSAVEMARALSRTREVLEGYEASALAGVEATLAEVAESLARRSRELREMGHDEWTDADQAASYFNKTPKTFRIVAAEDVPQHYLTERGVLSSRRGLDEWLMAR